MKTLYLFIILSLTPLGITDRLAASDLAGVRDYAKLLKPDLAETLSRYLSDHENSTGDRLVVMIEKSGQESDPAQRAKILYEQSGLNQDRQQSSALFLITVGDRIHFSYAIGLKLQPLLDIDRISQVSRRTIVPLLESGRPEDALGSLVYEVMESLHSPVLHAMAEEIKPVQLKDTSGVSISFISVFFWILFGAAGMLGVGYLMTAADAHFTSSGWSRLRPWIRFKLSSKEVHDGGGAAGSW